jgi:hypothetical protein
MGEGAEVITFSCDNLCQQILKILLILSDKYSQDHFADHFSPLR